MMSGWKEKGLLFKPIDIAKDTPFNVSKMGKRKSQANSVGKEELMEAASIDQTPSLLETTFFCEGGI